MTWAGEVGAPPHLKFLLGLCLHTAPPTLAQEAGLYLLSMSPLLGSLLQQRPPHLTPPLLLLQRPLWLLNTEVGQATSCVCSDCVRHAFLFCLWPLGG